MGSQVVTINFQPPADFPSVATVYRKVKTKSDVVTRASGLGPTEYWNSGQLLWHF